MAMANEPAALKICQSSQRVVALALPTLKMALSYKQSHGVIKLIEAVEMHNDDGSDSEEV
jgi:hypothetical protein